MKYLVNLFIICSIIIVSCNENEPSNNDGSNKYVKCTIDGTKWIAKGTIFTKFAGTHYNTIYILAYKNQDSIEFFIKYEPTEQVTAKSYQLSKEGYYFGILHRNGSVDTSSSGDITFATIEYEETLKAIGTFNLNIVTSDKKNIVISDGTFNSGN